MYDAYESIPFFYSVMRFSASQKALQILLDECPYSVLTMFTPYPDSKLMLLQTANRMWSPTYRNQFSRRERHFLASLKNVRIFRTSTDLRSCHSQRSLDIYGHLIMLLVRIVHAVKLVSKFKHAYLLYSLQCSHSLLFYRRHRHGSSYISFETNQRQRHHKAGIITL